VCARRFHFNGLARIYEIRRATAGLGLNGGISPDVGQTAGSDANNILESTTPTVGKRGGGDP